MPRSKPCECGCGMAAPIATQNSKRYGHVKGQPTRFLKGHSKRIVRPPIPRADLLWLAGLLEGEGSFMLMERIRRPKNSEPWIDLMPAISVGMTDRDVIDRVAALLGTRVNASPREARRKDIYLTRLIGYYALDVMRRLRPLMGERRRGQIDRCLVDHGRHEVGS